LPPAHIHLRVSQFFKSQSGTHFAWIIYVLIFFLETFIVLSRRGVHTLCLDHLYGYLFHPLCTLVLLTSLCTIQTWANSSISSPNSSSLPKHSEPYQPITGLQQDRDLYIRPITGLKIDHLHTHRKSISRNGSA
jgi:hypothetical protein